MKVILSGIVVLSIIFFSVQYADADHPLFLKANNGEIDMLLIVDTDEDYIKLAYNNTSKEYTDLDVKSYKNGTYRLSNQDILFFMMPLSEDYYKLIISTDEIRQKFIGIKNTPTDTTSNQAIGITTIMPNI